MVKGVLIMNNFNIEDYMKRIETLDIELQKDYSVVSSDIKKKLSILYPNSELRISSGIPFLHTRVDNTLITERFDPLMLGIVGKGKSFDVWLKSFVSEDFFNQNNRNKENKMLPHYTIDKIVEDTVYYRKNKGEKVYKMSLFYLRYEVFSGNCVIENPIKFVESVKVDKLYEKVWRECFQGSR